MFLDPEPRRQVAAPQEKRTMSGSPLLLSARSPVEPTRDRKQHIPRKPLTTNDHQVSQTQNDQQQHRKPQTFSGKHTIRLVTHSPSPPTSAHSNNSHMTVDNSQQHAEKENQVHELPHHAPPPPSSYHSRSDLVQGASANRQGLPALSEGEPVSHSPPSTNEPQTLRLPPSITLLPTTSEHPVPNTAWHRRSGSSGNYSNSSTLIRDGDGSLALSSSSRRSETFSLNTTLRGTPTPYEQEHEQRECAEAAEEDVKCGVAHALQTLEETSPERPTISSVPPRPISPVPSSSTDDHLDSGSDSSLPRRSAADTEQSPSIPHRNPRRSSTSLIPASLHVRKESASSTPQEQSSPKSTARPETTVARPSSPFTVRDRQDISRPRSRSQPPRFTPSIESIQSYLHHPLIVHPDTDRVRTASASLVLFPPSSSDETLPPLRNPKKRLRYRPASRSLDLDLGSRHAPNSRMASEDFDPLPYPRQQFNSHLSTIASESDWQSRATSGRFSYFSLGSGVMTPDDSSGTPLSGPRGRRRENAPVEPTRLGPSRSALASSSDDEPGDMTLGVFREESAKPQPLFNPRSPSAPGEGRKYDGPLPPLPPIPKSRDSDEDFDTVSELQYPALRPCRSGYSLRRRSNSTPSQGNSHSRHQSQISYVDSERGSHGSSLFPTWAKHFYSGTGALISSSKISLGSNSAPMQQARQPHVRNDSQRTERSITSRLGTGYSEIDTGSPTSSHFLPSIFRPRTRPRANTIEGHSRIPRSKRSRPSGETDSRPDSLAIYNDPLPEPDTLPSGQPKWGILKDTPDHPPLPRKYSKQRQWDTMEFPRPMTKDRLSSSHFTIQDPHLAPSKRTSYRLSAWQAPSFVESLDTLVRSRCNRQILLFALGFVCPLLWMLGAILPLPKRPLTRDDVEKGRLTAKGGGSGSEEDLQTAMMKHEAGDAERRWREERSWVKARWWRRLNRGMSVLGVLIVGAVIALVVVATR